ncbi:ribosomal protection-like ABC-F family protein [Streptococcus plurextorum]|uniref:ribosomal protection-like ABC-F family protein n=1 Tax=Streptococcus plurextorum TaxID=456876 RepID=UPI00041B8A69|nr:ATP-binding cassette domain-containing protein [Streptococcus plurextorum]
MEVIRLEKIVKDIPERLLFECDSLHLLAGEKVGLVGENGAGKTSLLRLLIGEDKDYSGKVCLLPDFAYVPQLKITSQQSGGEQAMELLREAVRQKPSLLILDEPTANLDRDNRRWLIKALQGYRGSLLVVSHDRDFLNQVTTITWYLENSSIRVYQGAYAEALKQRQKDRDKQLRDYQIYQEKIKQLQDALLAKKEKAQKMTKKKKSVSSSDWKVNSKLGNYDGKAKSMAQAAKTMEKRIKQLKEVSPPKKEAWANIRLIGEVSKQAHTLMRLTPGEVKVEERHLFSYPELAIRLGDRIGLVGANQVGKTTFVRQLLRQSLDGYYAKGLEVSYFSQNMNKLELTQSAVENVATTSAQGRATILNFLAMLNIRYDKAQKKVEYLSGGERMRVQLAKCLLSDNNFLILDEPTNFLDVIAIEALEKALKTYQGSLLLISHDQLFIDQLANRIWEIKGCHLSEITG